MIKLNNITVTYSNRNILHDVSVSFFSGLNYLIGLNGSGKTTLAKSILKLVPYSGEILLDEQNMGEMNPANVAKKIAVVHQQLTFPFKVSLYDYVLMGRFPYLNWLGDYKKSDHEVVQRYLKEFALEDLSGRSLNEMSGGELQKACIARALTQETSVLILDEPAQSLDPKNKEMLYHTLETLSKAGKLVLCITHDLEALQNPEARVLGIRDGQIVWDHPGGKDRRELMQAVYGS